MKKKVEVKSFGNGIFQFSGWSLGNKPEALPTLLAEFLAENPHLEISAMSEDGNHFGNIWNVVTRKRTTK